MVQSIIHFYAYGYRGEQGRGHRWQRVTNAWGDEGYVSLGPFLGNW